MLLRSLEVENFRLLRHVRLTFGTGLNVLFGPNDLGKSTLVEALRAAFLLPVGSAASQDFRPWGTDLVPRVVVVFEASGAAWKITKEFTAARVRGAALLEHVVGGGTFVEERRGRAVDGKLREILAWGIREPGGKGAPKGFPESYLITALLGRQEDVSTILDASLEDDSGDSGLRLVTQALGALGQDPIVSRMLDRLKARCAEAFAPGGGLARGKDAPLVKLMNRIRDQEERVREIEERARGSEAIERRVQLLSQRRILANKECSRLEQRINLLRAYEKAKDDLTGIQAHRDSVGQAERVLATVEEVLREEREKCEQMGSALTKIEEELRGARDRLSKASAARDNVRENTEHMRRAREAELVAQREAAESRMQAARSVLHSLEEVQLREQELVQAEADHHIAVQACASAQDLVDLAKCLAELRRASKLLEAADAAQTERDEWAKQVAEKDHELRELERALENADRDAISQKEAMVRAERVAAERDLRKETLRSSLFRAETTSSRIKTLISCSNRLSNVETALVELEVDEREIDAKIAANAAAQQSCRTKRLVGIPQPWPAALVAALLGGSLGALVGMALKLDTLVVVTVLVGCAVLTSALATVAIRLWKRTEANRASGLELEELARVSEALRERRNQALTKRGIAQVRVDAARSERDQALAALAEPEFTIELAQVRLQKSDREAKEIKDQLAALDCQVHEDAATAVVQLLAPDLIEALKGQVLEVKESLQSYRQCLAEAQVRAQMATSSSASRDIVELERRVTAARTRSGKEADFVGPDPDAALAEARSARQGAVELETAARLATGRLADARAKHEQMASALARPADQVMAEAEKARLEADNALNDLKGCGYAEAEAAEGEFSEAQAEVLRLSEEHRNQRTEVDLLTKARDETLESHHVARSKREMLSQTAPSLTMDVAEARLAEARSALTSNAAEPGHWPADLPSTKSLFEDKQAELRRVEDELQAARGQLELVGGMVVREQREHELEALEALRRSSQDLELEYRATKRVLDVVTEAEAKQAAHLGRSLAKPVNEKFLELTSGRYAQVALEPSLRVHKIGVTSGEHDADALSVGTRDQLATLVRLALAAHLKSVVVLDDQLTHSDPRRLVWFRECLRGSVRNHSHQVIVITCRPLDYLSIEEMPVDPCDKGAHGEDRSLVVVDLERLFELE